MSLDIRAADRKALLHAMADQIDAYLTEAGDIGAGRPVPPQAVQEALASFDFDRPVAAADALDLAASALRQLQPHSAHPRYFGLFESAPTTMGVIGHALAGAFNACLATRDGSPFAAAAEAKLISSFGTRLGFGSGEADGFVTTGGSEANFSAVQLALARRLPECTVAGLAAVAQRPAVYVSPEAHPSVPRAVRLSGLGHRAVREVGLDRDLRMDPAALERQLNADRAAGLEPLAVVLTAGTTAAGVIDPIEEVAGIAARHGLWLHVDAAWGGAAALLPRPDPAFRGLARADSLTLDPHKWLSVPLGTGLLLTRHQGLLDRAFAADAAFLAGCSSEPAAEPFGRSLRWSRSFAALSLLLSLSVAGWHGYAESIGCQLELGNELRRQLAASGWQIVNTTPLPVVCFLPPDPAGQQPARLRLLAGTLNAGGEARIEVVRCGGRPALRACITNHATTTADVSALVRLLGDASRRRG
ncbi:MAG: aminotransferase class V-fold PLP-dependent enzyme [Actinobacteria bacterium]|nr:aminotransferase class V-fold PLP-dependent enzyme [Actinomycetota bacterium]